MDTDRALREEYWKAGGDVWLGSRFSGHSWPY